MKDRFDRYFNGGMSPSEEEQFRLWLAEHEDDPQLEGYMRAAFDGLAGSRGRYDVHSGWRRYLAPAVAASLALLLCLSLSFVLGRRSGRAASEPVLAENERLQSVRWLEKRVPYGETDTLLLADGSVLYLNAGSRVTYPDRFEGHSREVFVDGEVFARIAHNEDLPFYMRSGETSVQVLGTTFDFKTYDDDRCVECSLVEGSVRLSVESGMERREILMKPGNMVQYDRSTGDVSVTEFQTSAYRSFADGNALHFNNLTMRDIAAALERTFATRIVLMDNRLADARFFAIFNNNESLENILRKMGSDGRMRVRQKDGCWYLSSR